MGTDHCGFRQEPCGHPDVMELGEDEKPPVGQEERFLVIPPSCPDQPQASNDVAAHPGHEDDTLITETENLVNAVLGINRGEQDRLGDHTEEPVDLDAVIIRHRKRDRQFRLSGLRLLAGGLR